MVGETGPSLFNANDCICCSDCLNRAHKVDKSQSLKRAVAIQIRGVLHRGSSPIACRPLRQERRIAACVRHITMCRTNIDRVLGVARIDRVLDRLRVAVVRISSGIFVF